MFFRDEVTIQSSGTSPTVGMVELPGKKKHRKFYSIVPENWNLALKIESESLAHSEESYKEMCLEEDLKSKKELMTKARVFLQSKFRSLEIGEHFFTVPGFWSPPHGSQLLSAHFEWLTGGSGDGWLEASVERNLEPVLLVVAEILSRKKGKLWTQKFDEEKVRAEMEEGNQLMVWVFLIREWSGMQQDQLAKVLFLEGTDQANDVSTLPYVHIRKVSQSGGDFPHKVIISVMAGNSSIFQDIGLSAAIAAVLEIYFSFNLHFDKDCDDTLNFLQRVIGGFGDQDGARLNITPICY